MDGNIVSHIIDGIVNHPLVFLVGVMFGLAMR